MMQAKLIYVTDAYCTWCFGFGSVMERVANEYAGNFNVEVFNGGMIPQPIAIQNLFSRFPDPMALHKQITDYSGREFGSAYLWHIQNLNQSKRLLNSTIPAQATTAFRELQADANLQHCFAISKAYYQEGLDLQDDATYSLIAQRFNLDAEKVLELLHSPRIVDEVKKEFLLVQRMGVRGYPALILQTSDDKLIGICNGYTDFDSIKKRLDSVMQKEGISSAGLQGVSCAIDGTGC